MNEFDRQLINLIMQTAKKLENAAAEVARLESSTPDRVEI
jgi:hypothetical protein